VVLKGSEIFVYCKDIIGLNLENSMKLLFGLITAALLLWMMLRRRSGSQISMIEPAELVQALQKNLDWKLVDIRPASYFHQDGIPQALNITLDAMKQDLSPLASYKDHRIVTLCHTGYSARSAVALLQSQGFKEVVNLRGGMQAWNRAMQDTGREAA
jgi:rhodanese-related sulfurtransferase